jgi:hypothetical protein
MIIGGLGTASGDTMVNDSRDSNFTEYSYAEGPRIFTETLCSICKNEEASRTLEFM